MNAHLHAVLHKNYCTVRGIVKMLILCHRPTDKRNTTRRYEKEAVDLPWQANKNFRIERHTNRETDRQTDCHRQRKRQRQIEKENTQRTYVHESWVKITTTHPQEKERQRERHRERQRQTDRYRYRNI